MNVGLPNEKKTISKKKLNENKKNIVTFGKFSKGTGFRLVINNNNNNNILFGAVCSIVGHVNEQVASEE